MWLCSCVHLDGSAFGGFSVNFYLNQVVNFNLIPAQPCLCVCVFRLVCVNKDSERGWENFNK